MLRSIIWWGGKNVHVKMNRGEEELYSELSYKTTRILKIFVYARVIAVDNYPVNIGYGERVISGFAKTMWSNRTFDYSSAY